MEEVDCTTKRPIQKNTIGLNVNLYPKANVRNDFLRAIADNKKGTDTTEPLALQYFYGEATNAPGGPELPVDAWGGTKPFYLHEQYSGDNHGKEGFDAHASSPHFAAWEDFVATDPFEKDPEVFFFHILEP
jgi:quinol monooxygenase YgiN